MPPNTPPRNRPLGQAPRVARQPVYPATALQLPRLNSTQFIASAAQFGVLAHHPVHLRAHVRRRQHWPRREARNPDRLGELQIRLDGGDDNARLDAHEIDADQRNADVRVNDDALVEDTVENVNEATAGTCPFDRHVSSPKTMCVRSAVAPAAPACQRVRPASRSAWRPRARRI